MKVLVVGGGGREHAIVWKLKQSPLVTELLCAPGNGGIANLATCVDIAATDIENMTQFALREKCDFVVVAPDDPLAMGMVDALEAAGLPTFGPRKNAAILESSKSFSKNFMQKYHIPTAGYAVFTEVQAACDWLESQKMPIVVKADGLAMGKGVVICETLESAKDTVWDMMEKKKFGEAGSRIVIEEFLSGPEVTVLAFTDGETMLPMVSSQDHKRAFDNDEGLNTGGMGTFSPSQHYSDTTADWCMKHIFLPTMEGMNQEGRPFQGVIYFGLMLTADGPKVIEYNARFGDPETQVLLPRMENDLMAVFLATREKRLNECSLTWKPEVAVCVMMASGGYPEAYSKGYKIDGLAADENAGVMVFHSGTRCTADGYVTAGGRVLGVTALGEDMAKARELAYAGVEKISFEGAFWRTDIGIKK